MTPGAFILKVPHSKAEGLLGTEQASLTTSQLGSVSNKAAALELILR